MANAAVRVLHLTDPHLFADESDEFRGRVTYSSLREVLSHYRASDWVADVATVTGDLIQDDSAEAYRHFKDQLQPLGLPVHCVPGNHDVRALMRAAISAPPFYYCDAFEAGNWLLIGIDSCIDGHAGGEVAVAELARLDKVIEASGADHVMICLHHPPVVMGSAWLDTVGLIDGDAFLQHIHASGRVRLAIFGHVHQPYDQKHGDVRIIGTPSTCRQFQPGSDDFAVDNRSPAYRRITLQSDGQFETELIWLDEN